MRCPRCGAEHPHHAMACDCGHDFLSPKVRTAAKDPSSFDVQRLGVSHQSRAWALNVSGQSLILSGPGPGERLVVPKAANGGLEPEIGVSLSGSDLSIKTNGGTYQFRLSDEALPDVRSWMPCQSPVAPPASGLGLGRELRKWGIGLIILGVAHFVLAEFLDPTWGAVIIVLGIANLAVRHAAMFVVNGLALMLVGILNIAAGGTGSWSIFGVMQLYWGVREIRKYSRYATKQRATEAPARVQPAAPAAAVETA